MNKYIMIISSIFVFGCKNEIPKDKITTIDNFVLGQSINNYSKQMDSLNIPHQRFLTKLLLRSFNDIMNDDNYINMYYTNTFNFSNSGSNENLGLLYPIIYPETQNITGIIVILGHTTKPWLWGEAENFKATLSAKVYIQDINANLINDVKILYISKYGEPSDTFSMSSHRVYFIHGNQIVENGDPDRTGLDITWKTEFYNITFFEGLPSYNSIYDLTKREYEESIPLLGSFILPTDPLKNEVQDFSYCYIEYLLNDKAIKILKLDKRTF